MEDGLAPESLHLPVDVEGMQDEELLGEGQGEESFVGNEVAKEASNSGGIPSQQAVDEDRNLESAQRGVVERNQVVAPEL